MKSYFHYHDQSLLTVSWPDVVLMLDTVNPIDGRDESGLNQIFEGIDNSSTPVLTWIDIKEF
ncbi:hypothetical protein MM213_02970 [Belliella sp. R4-6]|uniref:Uncharacterized protein n=1 Tax=Belliella alkalica TaxID=1730871 RepID=A0ABS9V7P2_9BACT|nr:hypothetical protein [Belliella alkalica]MCH7412432.1 hypothetical protein [Belliella alkalica]